MKNASEGNRSKENARVILGQLGGGRFISMTGAKNFFCDGLTLNFKIARNRKNVNCVSVEYVEGADLYNMKFEAVRLSHKTLDVSRKVIAEYEAICFDELQEKFTDATGMATRLF